MLQLTHLMSYRTKAFRITPKGRDFLADDRRGELLTLLFVGLLRDSDLRDLGRSDGDYPGLDASLPVCLYLIRRHATEWISAEELTDASWLPSMRDEPAQPSASMFSAIQYLTFVYTARVLSPLVAFGLMERNNKKTQRDAEIEYRTTPLFDALLHFDGLVEGPTDPTSALSLPRGERLQ